MAAVSDRAYRKIMRGISAKGTASNLLVCHAWQQAEGADAKYNPFNTTQWEPGAVIYNTFGKDQHVYSYPDVSTGITATVRTLLNGNYPTIVSAFRASIDGLALCQEIDASPWGTSKAEEVWRSLPAVHEPPGPAKHGWYHRELFRAQPMMHGADVRAVQHAVRNAGGFAKVDGWFGTRTEDAVRAYQAANHLVADGVVGPATAAKMGGR